MNQGFSNQHLLRFFNSAALGSQQDSDSSHLPDTGAEAESYSLPKGARGAYAKPLRALSDFLASHDPGSSIGSTHFLESWLIYLYFRGLTSKSAIHYLDILSALYGKAAEALDLPATTAFSEVKKRLKSALPDIWKARLREDSFEGFLKLLKSSLDREEDPATPVVRDMVLVALLNPGLTLAEVGMLRKEDADRFEPAVREILERHIDAKRKFIFPLGQTKHTPKQFRGLVEDLTRRLFEKHLLQWFGDADTTLKTYWAYAALRSGMSPHPVTEVTGPLPSTLPILALALRESTETEIKSGVAKGHDLSAGRSRVVPDRDTLHPCTHAPMHPNAALAALLLSNSPRWYAMRMRRGVRFDHLQRRIEIASEKVPAPSVYYPYEEITRRIGKRIEFKRKPVISDIVFFRYRATEIPRLFGEIGDLGWCYRTGGQYAAIPERSMLAFQQTVGMFTPDFEVGEGGALTLRENEKVVVLGGMFAGLEGEVLEAMETTQGVVYRLRLFGESNDIEWRLANPALLRKLP